MSAADSPAAPPRPLLLNPGPVTLSERVRASLLLPDLCHREPEFFELQREIRMRLLQVYGLAGGEWAAVPLSGSGTAAVEAMLSSLIPAHGRLLVLENGVYGERMTRIARVYGIPCETLTQAWQAGLDPAALERRLASGGPRLSHVAVVHHETTTGRLNPLPVLQEICARYGVELLVDAVSSFGAEPIGFGAGLGAVAATANKCLHGVPGACFVIARRAGLANGQPRNLYLDLAAACRPRMPMARRSRRRCMPGSPCARRCASSTRRAGAPRAAHAMPGWPTASATASRSWACSP
jgi:Serine-pyruvate aminotransferase/archaeal aspartate aminotransferase